MYVLGVTRAGKGKHNIWMEGGELSRDSSKVCSDTYIWVNQEFTKFDKTVVSVYRVNESLCVIPMRG